MQNKFNENITVLGAGAFGTVFTSIMANNRNDCNFKLWSFEKSVSVQINSSGRNEKYCPGIEFGKNVVATSILKSSVENSSVIFLTVPAKYSLSILKEAQPYFKKDALLIICSKGLAKLDGKYLPVSVAASEILPNVNIGVISGPNHVTSIKNNENTVLVYSEKTDTNFELMTSLVTNKNIVLKYSNDTLSAELGGVLKNPAAILYGLYEESGNNSDNFKGILLSSILSDINEIYQYFGANRNDIIGESCLGDIISTLFSENSRNKKFGSEIYKRISTSRKKQNIFIKIFRKLFPKKINDENLAVKYVAEGAFSIKPLIRIADKNSLKIPVFRLLYDILRGRANPDSIEYYIMRDKEEYFSKYKEDEKRKQNMSLWKRIVNRKSK